MKIKLNKGLQLTKESLTRLEDIQIASVKGGQRQKTIGARCSSCVKHSCGGGVDQEFDS